MFAEPPSGGAGLSLAAKGTGPVPSTDKKGDILCEVYGIS